MKHKRILALVLAAMISFSIPVSASATWQQDSSGIWSWTENGERATGWKTINGKTYYFNENGDMQTGWIEGLRIDGLMAMLGSGIWQYADASGAIVSNKWIQSGNKWYYLSSKGYMLRSAISPEGYVVNQYGVWDKSIPKIDLTLPQDTNVNDMLHFIDEFRSSLKNLKVFMEHVIDIGVQIKDDTGNNSSYNNELIFLTSNCGDFLQTMRELRQYCTNRIGLNLYCNDLTVCINYMSLIGDSVSDLYRYKFENQEDKSKILLNFEIMGMYIAIIKDTSNRIVTSINEHTL